MIYLLLLIMPFLLDRISKTAVLIYLHGPVAITQHITLVLAKNRGISWSLLSSDNTPIFVFTTVCNCVIVLLLAYITYKNWRLSRPIVGNLLVISGALSNICDRFLYSGVIDFIEISYKGYCWPVFNIADCAIVLGVCIMLIYAWKD